MIPKACKTQFRTPFRGRPISGRSTLAGPQCPEPTLAETPIAVQDCSQFSTPGITVDAIKTIIRRSPVRASMTRNKVIRRSKKCQENTSATAILHQEQRKPNERRHRKAAEEEIIKERKRSENKPKNIRSSTKVTHLDGCDDGVTRVLKDSYGLMFENADPSPRVCDKKSLSNNTPSETGGARTPQEKRLKIRVKTNRRSDVQNVIKKCYPAYTTTPLLCIDGVRDGDEVVLIDENAFVYEEHFDEPESVPAGTKSPSCDVFNFIPDSPNGRLESKRAKKEQVRLQVLKNIYHMETELAVFRHRRHKLRAKVMKGNGQNVLHLVA